MHGIKMKKTSYLLSTFTPGVRHDEIKMIKQSFKFHNFYGTKFNWHSAFNGSRLVVHSRDLADPACMPPDCFNGPRRVGVAAKPQAVHNLITNRSLNQSSICLNTCPSVCWGMFKVFYEKSAREGARTKQIGPGTQLYTTAAYKSTCVRSSAR